METMSEPSIARNANVWILLLPPARMRMKLFARDLPNTTLFIAAAIHTLQVWLNTPKNAKSPVVNVKAIVKTLSHCLDAKVGRRRDIVLDLG